MQKYFYFWIFVVVVRAIHEGYKQYKEYLKAGYNTAHFEQTGEKVVLHGGTGEAISCALASAVGLIIFPVFLLITTIVYYLPAALVLYLISK